MPKKNSEEKQIARQWRILHLIDRKWGVSKQELIRELSSSERTIERDIDALSTAGFPFYEERDGREKRYKFRKSYDFPTIELSSAERLSLSLAQDLASFLQGTPYHESIQSAFKKIKATLSPYHHDYLEKISKFISFRLEPIKQFQKQTPFIRTAENAWAKQQLLFLKYRPTRDGQVTERNVEPHGLYQQENALRLVAYCRLRNAFREFVFDNRMEHLEMLEEKFQPRQFELSEYVKKGFGVMKGEKVEAKIHISPPVSRWVRENKWPGLIKQIELPDDHLEMHFDTEGKEGLKRWILQWGKHAQVLSPEDFREEIEEEIQAMLKNYQKK